MVFKAFGAGAFGDLAKEINEFLSSLSQNEQGTVEFVPVVANIAIAESKQAEPQSQQLNFMFAAALTYRPDGSRVDP